MNCEEEKSLISKASSDRDTKQKLINKNINYLKFDQETNYSYVYIAYLLLVSMILFEQVILINLL